MAGEEYRKLRTEYVSFVRDFEKKATEIGLLKRYIEPHFGADVFIDGAGVRALAVAAPKDEAWRFIGMPYSTKGITSDELRELTHSIPILDKERKAMHDRLRSLGAAEGLDENMVMADIVLHLHSTWSMRCQLDAGSRALVANGGSLTLGGTAMECSFSEQHPPGSYSYREVTMARRQSEVALASYLSGERTWGIGYYRFGGESRLEDTVEMFTRIMEENKDVPMSFGFTPSHCAHGRFVYAHNLRADLSGLDDVEVQVGRVVESMRKHLDV